MVSFSLPTRTKLPYSFREKNKYFFQKSPARTMRPPPYHPRLGRSPGLPSNPVIIIPDMPGLLETKLHRPAALPRLVLRTPLIRRLNDGLASGRALTLVSAPAGFGKTACISQWLDTLDIPVAWLSLDPSDDDPGRFFHYLIAALQTIDPNLASEIEAVLRSGQLPPADVISITLINDLLQLKRRCLLVLDDFHVLQDRSILQVMEKLVTNLPAQLHLVLLTREDPSLPLARLRAGNQLSELRAADLRFTTREAACLLNERLGLDLSPAEIAALEERTEGWIAGLQLAALALQSVTSQAAPDQLPGSARSSFIANLSGSHRFILGYLTEEVLSRQPAEYAPFLAPDLPAGPAERRPVRCGHRALG